MFEFWCLLDATLKSVFTSDIYCEASPEGSGKDLHEKKVK
jgi:hypothetical protein